MPAISVILPTRLRNHLLARALQSLFDQTCDDFEIVVVDDNPPSRRVANDPSLAELLRHQRVRLVVHETPRNAAAARNVGLRVASGKWITYLDDDDAYHADKLDKQWQTALSTKLSIGLCGLAYNLARRRRLRQVSHSSYSGTDLLLVAVPDTKAIFHRRAEGVWFDESLDAYEDAWFFHSLVRHFNAKTVFNVPEPLIEVYPQPGKRVNTNAEAAWLASQAIHREFAPAYGPKAAQLYLAHARVGVLKHSSGNLLELLKAGAVVIRLGGLKECRAISNAVLFKCLWFRKYLVS